MNFSINKSEQAFVQLGVDVGRKLASVEGDIIKLQRAAQGMAPERVRELFMWAFATGAGVKLLVQGSGRLCWPSANDDARVKSVKNACSYQLRRVLGDSAAQNKPAARVSGAAKAVAQAAVQSVIDAGLTKAEVAAVIAALRAIRFE